MASAGLEAELKCAICLSIYTDPVTLSCGHNFCRDCIQNAFRRQAQNPGVYSCPQCRAAFGGRPALQKNTALSNIVEVHLPRVQEGNSAEPCPLHGNRVEYYCFKDTACICASCIIEDYHRGHQVMSLTEAPGKKIQELTGFLEQMVLTDYPERKIQHLREQRQKVQDQASAMKQSVNILFQDISDRLAELKRSLMSKISEQERHVSNSISTQIQHLESNRDEIFCMRLQAGEIFEGVDVASILQIDFSDLTNVTANRSEDLDEGPVWEALRNGLDTLITDVKNGYLNH